MMSSLPSSQMVSVPIVKVSSDRKKQLNTNATSIINQCKATKTGKLGEHLYKLANENEELVKRLQETKRHYSFALDNAKQSMNDVFEQCEIKCNKYQIKFDNTTVLLNKYQKKIIELVEYCGILSKQNSDLTQHDEVYSKNLKRMELLINSQQVSLNNLQQQRIEQAAQIQSFQIENGLLLSSVTSFDDLKVKYDRLMSQYHEKDRLCTELQNKAFLLASKEQNVTDELVVTSYNHSNADKTVEESYSNHTNCNEDTTVTADAVTVATSYCDNVSMILTGERNNKLIQELVSSQIFGSNDEAASPHCKTNDNQKELSIERSKKAKDVKSQPKPPSVKRNNPTSSSRSSSGGGNSGPVVDRKRGIIVKKMTRRSEVMPGIVIASPMKAKKGKCDAKSNHTMAKSSNTFDIGSAVDPVYLFEYDDKLLFQVLEI